MKPLTFDLIVPIYNIESELENCLSSLYHQTYPYFKVLMIDDGSSDGSHQIAKRYAQMDSRFLYFYKENGGLSDARNFGFARTAGDYVLFIDGDDAIEDNALELLQKQLIQTSLDVLEFNAWYVENGKKTSLYNNQYIDSGVVKNGYDYFVDNVRAGCMYSAVWSKVIKRSFLQESQLVFEKGLLHEDELWTPQLYLKAERIMYLDIPLYHYVQRAGSIMHQSNRNKNVQDIRKIYYQLEKIYQAQNLSQSQYRVLMSYLARKMLGSFYEKSTIPVTAQDRAYVLRNARTPKSWVQAIVFALSPTALPKISNGIKKIIRHKQ